MGIRQFRPMTPGTRFRSVSDFADVTKSEPEKSLLEPLRRTGGRNNKGHITNRWQGGGHKRRYRRIECPQQERMSDPGRLEPGAQQTPLERFDVDSDIRQFRHYAAASVRGSGSKVG